MLQKTRDVADLGVHTGCRDDELTGAASRVGVHEHHVGSVAERDVLAADWIDALRDRNALARQSRFRYLERRRL